MQFYSLRQNRRKSIWRRELRANSERNEKNEVFHIIIFVRDWRVIYDLILMKFEHVVPDDGSFVLTGVNRWTSSPVAWLFIPTW